MKVPKKSGYAKFRQVMRIGMIQLTMALTCCGLSMAATNYAQLLDKNVSISLSEVAFTEALKEIEFRANINFVYSVDQLSDEALVTLQATDKPLREILDQLLTPRHISYKVYEKDKTLSLKKQLPERQPGPKFRDRANTQTQDDRLEVSGTVTDAATQQPMPGVNILVKGTTAGTTTDAKGRYTLATREDDVLIFSFIGYASQEVAVRGRSMIDVILSEDIVSLKDVVINAGYYNTTRLTQTGNISKVTAEEIARQPVQNPLAALQGRVPGLEIIQTTGTPGGNFNVRLRGTNSIANGNVPLFIIDGVPYTTTPMTFNETSASILGNSLNPMGGSSPLNNINPADIESIEVLKDADATAIYGSRGSNGVILITTKKGKAGKTNVDINFYSGAARVTRTMEQLNTTQYVMMRKEAFANDNVVPTVANARDLMVWDTTRFTNWQHKLIGGTAHTNDVQVSVSGGEKFTQFSVGLGYHKETTVFPGDNSDQRISTRVSLTNTSANQKLKTTLTASYAAGFTDLLNQDLTSKALFLPPNAPALYDDTGDVNWNGWNPSGTYENPIAYLNRRYEANASNLIASMEIGYSILPNLEVKSRMGYTSIGMKTLSLIPISSLAPAAAAAALNTSTFSNSTFRNWMIEPQANWKPEVGKGKFDVLVGVQFLDQTSEGLVQTATGFSSEELMKNLAAAPNRTVGANNYAQYRYMAVFGRVNYMLANRYIINITGRRDGSSRFGPGKQFANFGAIGTAWIFSGEEFFKNTLAFLSFGKLRASYGITGNDQLTDYQYLDAYRSSSGAYQGVIGLTPARLNNPDFAWETNRKFEVGLELGFLDDKIQAVFSLYRNRSSNQLVGFPLPTTTGFNSIQSNFPATVQNNGLELEVTTENIKGESFSWTTSINFSRPKNELLEFPNIEASPVYANRYVVGEPLSISKSFQNTGVNPTTGIYQFTDVNQDGSLDIDDQQFNVFIGPRYFGGIRNSLTYKGFQLDILFQYAKQTGRNYMIFKGAPGTMQNQPVMVLNRWMNEGDASHIQRYGQNSEATTAYTRLISSNRSVDDASFIRLKNIALSYVLPSQWINKAKLSNARLFLQGQNLLTITRYEGLDPETQGTFLPPLRVLTAGFSLTF